MTRSEEEMRISIPLSAYLEVEKDYINDHSSDMGVPRVVIAKIEEVIIQRVIKDENLREELSRISKRIKSRKDLDIYTDRSLVVERIRGREEKKMGIGWVLVDEINKDSVIK